MKGFIPFGSNAPTAQIADARDLQAMFGCPISVYSSEQAIEDGILFGAGSLLGRRIIFTTNLLEKIKDKAALITIAVSGLALASRFIEPDLAVIEIGGVKAYAQDNGAELTFMLPEDY